MDSACTNPIVFATSGPPHLAHALWNGDSPAIRSQIGHLPFLQVPLLASAMYKWGDYCLRRPPNIDPDSMLLLLTMQSETRLQTFRNTDLRPAE
jgi:hypothetical protein